jgi:hypothetical protein
MFSCELTQPSVIPVYTSCAHAFPYSFLFPTLIPFARLVSVYENTSLGELELGGLLGELVQLPF